MVDRGECTFLNKTINIQNAGGEVALIVNNNDMDPRDFFMQASKKNKANIPTVMISQKDGQIIKDYWESKVKKGESVDIRLLIKFNMKKVNEHQTEKVDLYFTSAEIQMYEFLFFFRKYYIELGNKII
jgi:hypothetical protein